MRLTPTVKPRPQLQVLKTVIRAITVHVMHRSGADADLILLQARAQGLEDALAQVVLNVEQLPSVPKNENTVAEKDTPSGEH